MEMGRAYYNTRRWMNKKPNKSGTQGENESERKT